MKEFFFKKVSAMLLIVCCCFLSVSVMTASSVNIDIGDNAAYHQISTVYAGQSCQVDYYSTDPIVDDDVGHGNTAVVVIVTTLDLDIARRTADEDSNTISQSLLTHFNEQSLGTKAGMSDVLLFLPEDKAGTNEMIHAKNVVPTKICMG